MMLVDSHCHLDLLGDAAERAAIIERAQAAGVAVLQTIGTRLTSFDQVLEIAEGHPGVFCSVGVHPHRAAADGPSDTTALLARTAHPKVIGIGESGLDYYYENSPRDAQARSFRVHIAAARASGLPLIVHTRDADQDTIAMLVEAMAEGAFSGVIHCYSTSRELGRAAVEMGLYLGLGGILTFRRSEELRATVRELPLERLLLETDAPYLAPEPFRGKRNEPAHVAHVARTLADIKGLPVAEIARATSENFFRLFTKARPPDPAPCA
jgi:TatD DNase family protein